MLAAAIQRDDISICTHGLFLHHEEFCVQMIQTTVSFDQIADITLAFNTSLEKRMLDLHSHLLPGIDDGAVDLDMALEMARIAIRDGIHTVACTPHIYPGMYENDATGIRAAIDVLRMELESAGIPLLLVEGADVHLDTDLIGGIRGGRVPTLAGSRYLLLEPPHHVAPPRFEDSVFQLILGGIVPVITHPERLTWIEHQYPTFKKLVKGGAWMQVTAGSLTGRFGRRPQYWAERMLDEGMVHVLATDAHHPRRRPPLLAEGRDAAARRLGDAEAENMVSTRPQGIVDDIAPEQLPLLPMAGGVTETPRRFWQRQTYTS